MTRRNLFALSGVAIVLLIGCGLAQAQVDLHEPQHAVAGLLDLIRNNANQWSSRLQAYARQLFWLLVTIDFVLIFAPLILRNADLGEFLSELMRFILMVGFFASLLIFSVEWSEAIINSFRQAGATAAGVGLQLTPGDMFGLGVKLAYTVSDVNTLNPGVALAVAASAIIILLCYAFIAAFMALTLVESYIVINASVLFMGLGGSKFTREHAISILRYALSVGAKLFVLTLIVGLVIESAREWQAAYQHDNTSMWTMVGLALVCALLSKTIPDHIQALINGVSSGGGGIIGGMAAAGAAFGAGAMAGLHSAAQGSGMLGGVGKSVSDLLKSSGSPGSGGPGGGSSMNSMMGVPGGGGASARPGGSRVGGGSMNYAPPPAPPPSASGTVSGSGSNATKMASGTSSGGSSSGGTAKASTPATMAHAAAELGIKTFGTAASMAVPGMEGSESLSVGPPPSPPEVSDLGGLSGPSETPDNIIRSVSDSPTSVDPVAEPIATAPKAIDTMSDLQNALNNRGKLS
jgi:type IV secretion system protein TrbL